MAGVVSPPDTPSLEVPEPSDDGSEEINSINEASWDEEELLEIKWTLNINELPSDILSTILEKACKEDAGSARIAVSTSHVSKHWRKVALATSTMWARVDIRKDLELVRLFLVRSGTSPLDVQIYLNPSILESEGLLRISSFSSTILPARHRFRSFTFYYYYPYWLGAAASLLTSTPEINIESLDMRRLQLYTDPVGADHSDPGYKNITLLPKRLRYDGIHLPTESPSVPIFSTSTTWVDIRWPETTPSMRLFVDQLGAATNLEYLRITNYSPNWKKVEDIHGHSPHSFPSLREAVFEHVPAEALESFFLLAETPSLLRLSIDFSTTRSTEARTGEALVTISEQNPQLQQLHVSFCMRTRKWKTIFSNLPALTELQMTACYGSDKIFRCLVDHEPGSIDVLCPHLVSVTFEETYWVQPSYVKELVESRVGRRGVRPIKKLIWRGLDYEQADKISVAIGNRVPELVLEYHDGNRGEYWPRTPSDYSVSEQWIRSDDDLDLDSGDEVVLAEGRAKVQRPLPGGS